MRFAYADPPYPGQARRLYGKHPDYAGEVDHAALVDRLCAEFTDGWALSTGARFLRQVLVLCPEDVRVLAWVKPWCPFMPQIKVAYAWEPVIVRGGRPRPRHGDTVRDWLAASSTMKRGLAGVKPDAFCDWVFEVLGMEADDALADLFPGSGAVTRAWETWRARRRFLDATTAAQQALPLDAVSGYVTRTRKRETRFQVNEDERAHDAYVTSGADWERDAQQYLEPGEDADDPGGIPDPKPADEPHGHWHVKHPLTDWQRLWHLNHFGDAPGHSHEPFGLGPRC